MHTAPETTLRRLFDRAVAVADPMQSLAAHLSPKPAGRVVVIGAGKASARMAEAVEAAFAQIEGAHGPVEVLVANAGITADTLLLRMSEDDWSSVLDTNLTGSFRLAKRASKGMLRLRRGRIVLISSVVGMLGSAGQVNYAASKAGLVGMARSIARELGSRSITANVVAPGFIETDMTAVLSDEQKDTIKSQVPLQRYGTCEEVASTVLWLTGPGATYVTGAVIPVDGGLGMGH